ncbi:hypothetical protein K437DRAFT_35981 [Tilletiaria anomala UBC 951]|uniref:Uncharacterized protein n=1 Tax=Tilletiaria anomala (strain ATCC 24038 / CBS 436.72 / UBC 951) TaxID=1037660 RepID=A0A066VFX7_TILAU|nr:uncharacterized protein K437DRAFT_35981 [Tilletiaria anomala UBC 951]KDN37674.1 hypothetical protein K437DRAFT_35981 [Tilletiaria anomala UBC 951]
MSIAALPKALQIYINPPPAAAPGPRGGGTASRAGSVASGAPRNAVASRTGIVAAAAKSGNSSAGTAPTLPFHPLLPASYAPKGLKAPPPSPSPVSAAGASSAREAGATTSSSSFASTTPSSFGEALTILRTGKQQPLPPEWCLTFVMPQQQQQQYTDPPSRSGAHYSAATGSNIPRARAPTAAVSSSSSASASSSSASTTSFSRRKAVKVFRSPSARAAAPAAATSTTASTPSASEQSDHARGSLPGRQYAQPAATAAARTSKQQQQCHIVAPRTAHPLLATTRTWDAQTGRRADIFALTNDRYPGAPGTVLHKTRESAVKAALAAKREMARLAAKKAELEHILGFGTGAAPAGGGGAGGGGGGGLSAGSYVNSNGSGSANGAHSAAGAVAAADGLASLLGADAALMNGHGQVTLVREHTSALGKRQRKSASPYTMPYTSTGASAGPAAKRARKGAARSASAADDGRSSRAGSTEPADHHYPSRTRRPRSRGASPGPLAAGAAAGPGASAAGGGDAVDAAAVADGLSSLLAAGTRRGVSGLSKEFKPMPEEDEEAEVEEAEGVHRAADDEGDAPAMAETGDAGVAVAAEEGASRAADGSKRSNSNDNDAKRASDADEEASTHGKSA